ncbi:MAG: hypothetical protein ACRDGI_06745 [Candidatus Limnocylindrales bacterium]
MTDGFPPTGQFIQMPDGTLLPVVVGPGGEAGVIWQGQFVRLQDLPFQAVPFDTTELPGTPIVDLPGGPIGPLLPPPPTPAPVGPTGPPGVRTFNFTLLTFILLMGVMAILISIAVIVVNYGHGGGSSATASPAASRSYGLNITVSGTAGGQSADSQVYGPGSLSCTSSNDPQGELVQVTWTGRLADGRQVSGEFIGHLGRTDFGTNTPNSVGNANVSFGTSGRVGGGIEGGTGSLTMESAMSGSIDAELETDGQVHVYGTWTCASS